MVDQFYPSSLERGGEVSPPPRFLHLRIVLQTRYEKEPSSELDLFRCLRPTLKNKTGRTGFPSVNNLHNISHQPRIHSTVGGGRFGLVAPFTHQPTVCSYSHGWEAHPLIEIDSNYIDASAPNAAALANGRGLVAKGKLVALHHDAEQTILFGECSGSGKSNYTCSCDFAKPDQAVFRCSCPSRQFPCKHCLGLMFAWASKQPFTVAEVPADLASKREKAEQRVAKKKTAEATPRKVNKSALAKKIKAQLDGLELLQQITADLIRSGMGNTTAKTALQIEEQAKQLGNAFLPGAQSALHAYTRLFVDSQGRFDAELKAHQREQIYTAALDQLTRLHALAKQGRKYLEARLDDPDLKPDVDSAIAALLGHTWQLRELREMGLTQTDAQLVQLAFNSYDDVTRREFVDTGVWMNLQSGQIQLTQNFRPYKAAKFIRSDDSFFKVAIVPELCVYPGDRNPRIRWETQSTRNVEPIDLQRIRELASGDFAAMIKEVKLQLKNPLAEKQPIVAVNYAKIGQWDEQHLAVQDQQGQRMVFTESGGNQEPATCHLLWLLPPALHQNQTLIARFDQDLDAQRLRLKPLSIVTQSQIYRLTF